MTRACKHKAKTCTVQVRLFLGNAVHYDKNNHEMIHLARAIGLKCIHVTLHLNMFVM